MLFEILSFFKLTFLLFFWKNCLKKIQDGIRFDFSLQKWKKRKTLLQISKIFQCFTFVSFEKTEI
jgi:hypothetical protein